MACTPPHPYFGRKILVFMRLQKWLRCKIVKTMKFPAKSSRIRSYKQFLAFVGSFRLKGGDVLERLLESLCDEGWKSSANTCGATGALRAWGTRQ